MAQAEGVISDAQRARVAELLGREPRGLEEISVSDDSGEPVVIRVASLVDGKPFPTLFWLVGQDISYRIDRVEANGLIAELQRRIDADPELQQSMAEDHRAHKALRDSYIDDAMRTELERLGFREVFASKGIGGIADSSRIRCLHTWYAAHLVVPNTVGTLLDNYWRDLAAKP